MMARQGLPGLIVAAPVVVICCGGKLALVEAALFGTAGILSRANVLTASLMATLGAIALLAARSFTRSRNQHCNSNKGGRGERQTS